MNYELVDILPSTKSTKKMMAVFLSPSGKTRTVHFGEAGASDYTIHKDPERKERYLERHGRGRENWDDPTTPGALSRWILWNKPTLKASVKDYIRKFFS